ncbi:molybdopterin-dependent oxidoreductase [uncultured Thermanaerothrix sp.]|uniref:molybdopterin-dependent oxidoreductase n=1 Tax=uncultured Thermanaerothrix sp. TaxID=1195149 RepID=UPI00261ABDAC|nr:molybdopterin-dependent oxidoreductase [uncultured Thermanaerothrix sp.]
MATITINQQTYEVPDGITVLQAARQLGIFIPTLCDHPHLTPYGGCRLCMVEIEGFRTLQAACTIPVSNNMVIHTENEKIKKAREFALSLIFSERNHFCPYCQVSGGDCELQNAAYRVGMTHWPLQPNWQPFPVDASHPYIILEHNRCILCRRCIRACNELVGVNTLGVANRGARTFVIADFGVPLGESTCVSCGMCVQVCPTGAMIDRKSAYQGKKSEAEHVETICTGCSLGCGLDVLITDNRILSIYGNWDAPVNQGVLCKVGRYYPLDDDRPRITQPLVRKNGELQPTTWEEALSVAASALKRHSANSLTLASARLTAEALYLFRKVFAEGLHSPLVTTLNGHAMRPLTETLHDLGEPFEGRVTDLNDATSILIVQADLASNHEVLGFMVRRSLNRGVRIVIADSRENPLAALAEVSLVFKEGRQLAVVEGLMAAVARLGLSQTEYTEDAIANLANAAKTTGLATDDFLKAAYQITRGEKPVIIYDPAAINDVVAIKALVRLAKMTGATLISPKGEANSLVAAQFNLIEPMRPGTYEVAFVALGDEIPSETLVAALERTPFLIVQASRESKLTARADVVLPVYTWAEESGHYLNLEGRLQEAHPCLTAPGQAKSNEVALRKLAEALEVSAEGDWRTVLTQRVAPVTIAV